MTETNRYQQGQRWTFEPAVAGFENTLVIGNVTEAHPEWGMDERTYTVYVRYDSGMKDSIPPDYDRVILSPAETVERSEQTVRRFLGGMRDQLEARLGELRS